jgi:hypothetical protein
MPDPRPRTYPPPPAEWTWAALVPGDSIVLNGARDEAAQEAWEVEHACPHDDPDLPGWVNVGVAAFDGVHLVRRARFAADGSAPIGDTFPRRPRLYVAPSPLRRRP